MRSVIQKGQIANAATRSSNRERPGDVRSDCWPDSCCGEEDSFCLEAAARLNTPGIVFGEVGRVLGVVVIGIIVIDLGLKALNIQ
jgi:hypothetical protein